MHTTIPKGSMGYDQYTVPSDCSCRTYLFCFPLTLANMCPWPLVPFFQFPLENRADKTTHNTFRDCRVHFFRQPFSKQLYMLSGLVHLFKACKTVFLSNKKAISIFNSPRTQFLQNCHLSKVNGSEVCRIKL